MRTGFIGLGAMGTHMARNLARAGLLAAAWNRSPEKSAAFAAETGCSIADDPAALARGCDAVVVCVAADPDVLAMVEALLPAARPGLLVIDCSTVSADTARHCAALLSAAGAEFLDCPVSGGVEGARDATLSIMVGGTQGALTRATPVLRALGKTITHLGPSGAGQATKATNQILCAGIINVVGEALAFARAQALPLTQVVEALGKGAGSSWYFVNRAPYMIRGEYPAGFKVRLHEKDLRICRAMAAAQGTRLPVVEEMLAEYAQLIAEGHGDEDISAVFRLKERLFE